MHMLILIHHMINAKSSQCYAITNLLLQPLLSKPKFVTELDGGTKPRPIQEKILAQNLVQTPRKRRAKPSPTKEDEGRATPYLEGQHLIQKGKTEPNMEGRRKGKTEAKRWRKWAQN
jgi:hypothetical protein